eukprot:4827417-Amphidinium_carterae.1
MGRQRCENGVPCVFECLAGCRSRTTLHGWRLRGKVGTDTEDLCTGLSDCQGGGLQSGSKQ